MWPFDKTLSMMLNTGDVRLVSAIAQTWLSDEHACEVRLDGPLFSDRPGEQRHCTITIHFRGGAGSGRMGWGALQSISRGTLTITTDDGVTTLVNGEFDTHSSLVQALLPSVMAAIAVFVAVGNRRQWWIAVYATVLLPIGAMIFAEGSIGSMQQSLGKAINKRMSDLPGPRGFEVLPKDDD